jgi:hypothetical protein
MGEPHPSFRATLSLWDFHRSVRKGLKMNTDENISTEEIIEEVTSMLREYTDIVKRFWKLYEELNDETADKLTKAGAEKWLKYAFTLSMDELWFESMSWELTKEDMETN